MDQGYVKVGHPPFQSNKEKQKEITLCLLGRGSRTEKSNQKVMTGAVLLYIAGVHILL